MSELLFDIEWVPPESQEPPEFWATWAEMRISVEGQTITRFYDSYAESVRRSLVVPVYPLAEWVAYHWWNLLEEPMTPGRTDRQAYAERHNIRFAREGYALPDLQIVPAGERVRLSWQPSHLIHADVEFLDQGTAWIDRAVLEEALTRLLNSVTRRIEAREVSHTVFQQEWGATRSAGDEERDFCRAAAQLGLHPYSLSDEDEEAILQAADRIPAELHDEFFRAARVDVLADQTESLTQILFDGEHNVSPWRELGDLREVAPQMEGRGDPWSDGTTYARRLRQKLDLTERAGEVQEDPRAFEIAPERIASRPQETRRSDLSAEFFDALVHERGDGQPAFFITRSRETSVRFAFCRALFDYLTSEQGRRLHLITRTETVSQQRSRAFAAEFLAPAERIGEVVSGRVIDEEEVEDLADRFHVSPFVIQQQLEAHDIVDDVVPEAPKPIV